MAKCTDLNVQLDEFLDGYAHGSTPWVKVFKK